MSFQPNQQVFTCDAVNLRAAPGFAGATPPAVLALLPEGTVCTVTGPATPADGLTWWPVRVAQPGGPLLDGWAAERVGDNQLLTGAAAPQPPVQPVTPVTSGSADHHPRGARQPARLLRAQRQQRRGPLGCHQQRAAAGDPDPRRGGQRYAPQGDPGLPCAGRLHRRSLLCDRRRAARHARTGRPGGRGAPLCRAHPDLRLREIQTAQQQRPPLHRRVDEPQRMPARPRLQQLPRRA